MSVEERVICAFCMESSDVGVFGDGVTLDIIRAGVQSTQTIWAHVNCLDDALNKRIMRGEWLEGPFG
ncbi:hypothetical protein ACIBI4_14025 [Streptomyces sp. NPDC050418]|uniref:hypothetical protein n=1 Tax=Streptomyces sp. NPDC050418 TaxID=3365612 RepID=UPI0037B0BA08